MDAEPAKDPQALSVTQLLRRMKNVLEVQVGEVWVEGEVSNLRRQPSGHWYFSLKDDGAQISCAMFGARKRSGAEVVEDGAKVRVFAEATVYEARGQLQIIVSKIKAVGAGDLQAKFEALKAKLKAEGLFESARKSAIPRFPCRIGLITSGSGAALQDMLQVLQRRAPWVQPVLMPVRVQGKGAERGIAAAIERMGNAASHGLPVCDVLIVGRGGGSLEDLWNFNEEIVARAIADCRIPVISAVGHEIDFTIADFVADLRAPTPSAAAELAVVDGAELKQLVLRQGQRLKRCMMSRIEHLQLTLNGFGRGPLRDGERLLRDPSMRLDATRVALQQQVRAALVGQSGRLRELAIAHRSHHPLKVIERRIERVGDTGLRLRRVTEEALEGYQKSLKRSGDLVRTLGPESAFRRGFSITTDAAGKILRTVKEAEVGKRIRTRFIDGEVDSEVVD